MKSVVRRDRASATIRTPSAARISAAATANAAAAIAAPHRRGIGRATVYTSAGRRIDIVGNGDVRRPVAPGIAVCFHAGRVGAIEHLVALDMGAGDPADVVAALIVGRRLAFGAVEREARLRGVARIE